MMMCTQHTTEYANLFDVNKYILIEIKKSQIHARFKHILEIAFLN